MLLLGFMMCMKLHMPPRLHVSSSNCGHASKNTGTGAASQANRSAASCPQNNAHGDVHRTAETNLTATRFSEVGDRAELRSEQDGGEKATVERLNAFAGTLFIGVSGGGGGGGGGGLRTFGFERVKFGRAGMKGVACALDVNVAEHVIADVAADVELLHTAIPVGENMRMSCGCIRCARRRALLDVVVDVQVKVVEVFLKLFLILTEATQVVHLRMEKKGEEKNVNMHTSECSKNRVQNAIANCAKRSSDCKINAPEVLSTCAG
jgi:hypothetical protein